MRRHNSGYHMLPTIGYYCTGNVTSCSPSLVRSFSRLASYDAGCALASHDARCAIAHASCQMQDMPIPASQRYHTWNDIAPCLELIEPIRVKPALGHMHTDVLHTRRGQRGIHHGRRIIAQHYHVLAVGPVRLHQNASSSQSKRPSLPPARPPKVCARIHGGGGGEEEPTREPESKRT